MDERQTQIKEGAGREDSRLNTELIEFLQGPIFTGFLVIVVIISLGYTGLRWWENKQIQTRDAAFGEYAAAAEIDNPIPESIAAVIDNDSFSGVASVQSLARLRLAGIYMRAFRSGLLPGAEIDPETGDFLEDDILSDEQRESYLSQSEALYRQTLEATESDPATGLLAAQAAFGLAAVAESRGETERAESMFNRANELATAGGYPELGTIALARAETAGALPEAIELTARADLPPIPGSLPTSVDVVPEIIDPAEDPIVDEPVGPVIPAAPAAEDPPAESPTGTPADPEDPDGR